MALDHHPVQNSEVYLLNSTHAPSMPPPSPPSPATPCEELSASLDLTSITPPEPEEACANFTKRLANCTHVLGTEATSLSQLSLLYETDPIARGGFNAAVEAIVSCTGKGKVIVCGVGKSGHIGVKLTATFNSLKIETTFLHPTEALHGDLGLVGDNDTILFISNSGSTGELLALLPHFDASLPTIIMTSHTHPSNCEIIKRRPGTVLLPTPLHISEKEAFGVNAPTISTTITLALGDALAIAVSKELHTNIQGVFHKNHPGGAIGAAIQAPKRLSDFAISLIDMPEVNSDVTANQVVLKAYRSMTGWVRSGGDVVVCPRRIKALRDSDMKELAQDVRGLMVPRKQWIAVSAEMELEAAREWIQRRGLKDDEILVTMDEDEACGVVEVGEIMA